MSWSTKYLGYLLVLAFFLHFCSLAPSRLDAQSSKEQSTKEQSDAIYEKNNLVAWCIVPFDSKKRTPAERAAMLDRMGIHRLAYDYRAEHIPTFDDELDQLAKHGIELTAWWFPSQLNDEARKILQVLDKHHVKTQLWVSGGGAATKSPEEQKQRIEAESNRIRPIAEAAAKQGCTVGLYNHGGWFGEPENQLAIINHLQMKNVGIVYNLHHGHPHLKRLAGADATPDQVREAFKKLLQPLLPHLLAVNLNGMIPDGDEKNQKILPLGTGTYDAALIAAIRESGYTGLIGILNHTSEDAEARLLDNLDGLKWLLPQSHGQPAGEKPQYRSWQPTVKTSSNVATGPVERLAAAAAKGSAERGVAQFASARTACLTCHKIGKFGGSVGPELSNIGTQRTAMQLAESILLPNKQVEEKYQVIQALTGEGRIVRGYRVRETDEQLILKDPSTLQDVVLRKDDLDDFKPAPSMMPEGLAAVMSFEQQADLIAFLSDLGRHEKLRPEIAASVFEHAQPHEPATFVYDRAPLNKAASPDWESHVNRDRLYDFYSKEAAAFRKQERFEPLLAEYPGIDGGTLGHWGNQNEAVWENDDWNRTHLGSLQSGVFHSPNLTVARAVCVHLASETDAGQGSWSACFDPDSLSYRAVWSGGFLKFSKVRHGFMHGFEPLGAVNKELTERFGRIDASQDSEYHGFYRSGAQVVFAYRIGGTEYLDSLRMQDGKLVRDVMSRDQHPLRESLSSPKAQWPQTIETSIRLGKSTPYAIDKIELPVDNPWKALVYVGDHDFLPDGSALVCTMQGDVWHVSGFAPATALKSLPTVDAWPRQAKWRRFASGLHHALGLKIDKEGIFVLGRDQITRLKDTNQDGEADFYESFSRAYETSAAGHDFICGMERDASGYFWTASGNEGLLKISPDGRRSTVEAIGFRNPDGLGLYPDGTLTIPCSEGEWTPASMICAYKPGQQVPAESVVESRTGNAVPFFGHRGKQLAKLNTPPQRPVLPMLYLPRGIDNSAGGQVYIDSPLWGPVQGNMVHLSFGTGNHFLLLRDEVRGQLQGAIVPMPGQFASGSHRGAFSPHDGQLYVSGMAGWGTYTADRGSFERVRYSGQPVCVPVGFHLHSNGVAIRLSAACDRTVSAQASQHFAQCWNYRYSSAYGSAEYSACILAHADMIAWRFAPLMCSTMDAPCFWRYRSCKCATNCTCRSLYQRINIKTSS